MMNDFAPSVRHVQSRDIETIVAGVGRLYGDISNVHVDGNPAWNARSVSFGPMTLVQGVADGIGRAGYDITMKRHVIAIVRGSTIEARIASRLVYATSGGRGLVASPGRTVQLGFLPGMRNLNLTIDPAFVVAQFEALTGEQAQGTIDFDLALDLETGVGPLIERICQYTVDELDHNPNHLSPMLAASLCDTITRSLLTSHRHEQSHFLEKPTPPSSRTVVRLVEEYIDAHAAEPIVATDLTKVTGASVASIEAAFKQHRGTTSTAFMRQRRIEYARKALLHNPHLTNSKAALLAGYVGVPAFEAAYFKQFHESPAETRRRGFIASGVSLDAVESSVPDQRISLLSKREWEVCDGIAKGLLNKQIAGEMGLSEKTVQDHRGRAMRKLGVESVADFVRLWERLGK